MKKQFLSILSLFILSAAFGTYAPAADGFKVISANLRTVAASGKDGDNKWDNRKSAMARMLNQESPDVFGIQEGYLCQIDYLSENCPGYSRVGVGRDDGKTEGEFCSIFYKDSVLDIISNGDFWLSDSPDKPSKAWGEKYSRIVTWAKFKDRQSGRVFAVFNTHFPLSEEAKEPALDLLLAKIDSIANDCPLILTADWNMQLDHPVMERLRHNCFDLRTSFAHPDRQITYNGFGNREGKIIDHIFYRGLKSCSYKNLNADYGVPYISDHYPVEGSFNFFSNEKPLKVLAIGNSYSVDAVNQNFHELAEAAGKNLIIGNLYIGGCSLERHWTSLEEHKADYTYHKIGLEGVLRSEKGVEMTAGISDEDWDVVTLQQTSKTSGLVEGYEPYLGNLVAYLRRELPDAKIYWHQTWAYMENSTHGSFQNYDRDQMTMYRGIMARSADYCKKYRMEVIPSGTAIQNLRSSYIGQNVNRDGHHLGMVTGRYTAALTWYAVLFGLNPCETSYAPEGILPFQAEAAREAARLAVSSPYSCSSMARFQPSEDKNRMTPVDLSNQKILEEEVYGTCPGREESKIRFELIREKKGLFEGKANAREVFIYYCKADTPFSKKYWNGFRVLIFEPADAKGPVPVLLGINERGNHSISGEKWVHKPNKDELNIYKVYDNQPKGVDADIWKVEKLMDKGYALVTFCYADVCPDFNECGSRGVQRCYSNKYTWGALAAWAWSLNRTMDYLESCPELDAGKVFVFGEGKLGKAARWAAMNDGRLKTATPKGLPSRYQFNPGSSDSCGPYESHPHWYCERFYYHSAFPQP